MGNNEKSIFITGINVKHLFGQYNYNLKIPYDRNKNISKIGIIYGDNGTGKTTILNLLFHLLSSGRKHGHRSAIARIPFSHFIVSFSNRTKLCAIRVGKNLLGTYTISLVKPDGSLINEVLPVDRELSVSGDAKLPKLDQILEQIDKLGLSLFFIRDDRMLESDKLTPEFLNTEEKLVEEVSLSDLGRKSRYNIFNLRDIVLRQSLERTTTWIRQRVIDASRRGELEANQIYTGIVEKINKKGIRRIRNFELERGGLIEALAKLDARNKLFAAFGLTSRVNTARLLKGLKSANKRAFPIIEQMIRSLIESQEVRLDSLEKLNKLLENFVNFINEFLVNKRITLGVKEGIAIVNSSKKILKPENLSSGEKQLLLLFCNVLVSTDSASLFIIDEPEISLNVKWQRRLIDGLIEITRESQCQFLLATHSIELLTRHKDQLIKLISK